MNWDFWRIDWPNIAAVFALAVTPFFAMAVHVANDQEGPSFQRVGRSLPVVMLDAGSPILVRSEW